MKYVMFFTTDMKGNVVEGIGTDSFAYLDGRWSLNNCVVNAELIMQGRNKLGKDYVGFEIRQTNGNRIFSNYRTIYSQGVKNVVEYLNIFLFYWFVFLNKKRYLHICGNIISVSNLYFG